MRILITGANGFIGKNLAVQLREKGAHELLLHTRASTPQELADAVSRADFVFHLAGANRPVTQDEFTTVNEGLTRELCRLIEATGRTVPLVLTSSTQAIQDNLYGRSKRAAEDVVLAHAERSGAAAIVYRLPNVFGKWCRPNYNSVVATFCHNIATGLPITVNEAAPPLRLVYIDDVVSDFLRLVDAPPATSGYREVAPVYESTVAYLAASIRGFAESRTTLTTPRVGTGLTRALYSTYLSYLPPASFAYDVPRHEDPRGAFVEMLKTPDSGQFSYFTAFPGVTRGEHYHHTKTEKFLVIKGKANFGFRHITTGEVHHLVVEGGTGQIVETVPGWTHNITNIGTDELIVMLWANEIFDRSAPDTIALKVNT